MMMPRCHVPNCKSISCRINRMAQPSRCKIDLSNRGSMTALFCEPHPLLSYRTDIDINNNHAFIPAGRDAASDYLGAC